MATVDPTVETAMPARPPRDAPDVLDRWRALVRRVGIGGSGSRLGLVVIAVGLVVIGIGWNGAAGAGGEVNHVPAVQAQLPWLLSGGFLGLGIVILGAAMTIANAYRETEARNAARMDAILEALERTGGTAEAVVAAATGEMADLVVAGTASYHRPDCRLAKGRADAEVIPVALALERGLSPCRVCKPPTA
jgi:hypothetical protein